MNLAAIAYPQSTTKDLELIQNFRRKYDDRFKIVYPHFTFVFLIDNIEPGDFKAEIKLQLQDFIKIPFSLRCGIIHKDALTDNFHVFLVPDEGFSDMVKLHDKLYSHKLFHYLRLDLPFIPHITIANSPDQLICKKMADEWNEWNFKITGLVSTIDIVNIQNRQITTIEKIKLQ